MKRILNLARVLFLVGSVIFIGIVSAKAYLSDNEISNNNTFSAGTWEATPTSVNPGDVVINEVMYDPIGAEPQNEWVELYNSGDSSVDLTGYVLSDGEGSLILPSYILGAGSYAIFARDSAAFNTKYGFMPTFSGSTIVLANGGDDIALYDPTENVVDAATWKNGNFSGVTPHPGVLAQDHTIARHPNGADANNCAVDFVDSSLIPSTIPTPGGPNV